MAEIPTLPINPAFLLIDMQTRFVSKLDKRVRDGLVREQIKVLRFCAEKDLPLFVLEYYGYGPTVVDLKREIEYVGQSCLMFKNRNSGFRGAPLCEVLVDFRVDTVVPMGLNADACIWANASDAHECGFDVLVSESLIANGVTLEKTRKQRRNIRAGRRWRRENTGVYRSADELIAFLRREMETA